MKESNQLKLWEKTSDEKNETFKVDWHNHNEKQAGLHGENAKKKFWTALGKIGKLMLSQHRTKAM